MLEIQGKLISLEILEQKFVCNLTACKGACCIEGDEGAPLEINEVQSIEENLPSILPYLDAEGKEIIRLSRSIETESGKHSTPLKKNGACAYSLLDSTGVLHCAIEKSNSENKSSFLKPISCHLYPIRISKNDETGWEALNYHSWDICTAACNLGTELNVPVYTFLKTALIRKYGKEFYDELDVVGKEWLKQQK